jgi:hypothetical protein
VTQVRLRKLPYPYQAMLAINSGVERTSLESFREVHRFLNTRERTPLGRGLGLDIAGSLSVFGQRPGELALLVGGCESAEADEVSHYARTGWIDTLHTFGTPGSEAFGREHARTAIETLRARGLHLATWVNGRGRASGQNFGTRSSTRGDVPGAREFHTDLLLDYGVQFAWNQATGAAFGFDRMLRPMQLRDGQRLWGFSRHTTEVGSAAERIATEHGVKLGRNEHGEELCPNWWPELLPYQLSEEKLDRLLARGQFCVIAQNLGASGGNEVLSADAIGALRRLRQHQDDGRLLVARTSRMLEYQRVSEHLAYEVGSGGRLEIEITSVRDPVLGTFVPAIEQLRGITFHVSDPSDATLFVGGRPIPKRELVLAEDDAGGPTIAIRWFKPEIADQAAAFAAVQPVQARA